MGGFIRKREQKLCIIITNGQSYHILKQNAAQQVGKGCISQAFDNICVAMMQVIVSTDGGQGRRQAGDCKTETW